MNPRKTTRAPCEWHRILGSVSTRLTGRTTPEAKPPLILIVVIVAHHEPGTRQLGTKKTFPDLAQPGAGLGNFHLL
jgi:hypothetical protein